jgi:hypothetical protein
MNNRLQNNRKQVPRLFSSLLFAPYYLLLALLAVACPMGLIDDLDFDTLRPSVSNPTPDNPLTGDFVIVDYNLQAYVPVPVVGAAPVKSVANRGDMDITVVWKDSGGSDITALLGTFAPDAVYQAEISLTVKKGYVFGAIPFAYPPGAAEACSEDLGEKARVVSVTYFAAAAAVTVPGAIGGSLDLAPYLPSPATGAGPVVNFYQGTYGGTVVWKTGGTEAAGFFQGGLVYTAVVTLYPGPGCVFPDPVSVIYNKAGVIVGTFTPVPGTNQIRGQIEFPATGAVVDDLDLTDKIPAPVMGEMPVGEFSGLQYSGEVKWFLNETEHTGAFQYAQIYTPVVTLTAESGYTFTGVAENAFSLSGSTAITNAANSGEVAVTFPPVVFYPGQYIASFSGEHAKPMDSAIDVIRGTKSAYPGFISLSLSLDPGEEKVKLDPAEDLGRGQYLMYGLDLTNADSPSYVEIDGRGRTVDLTGTGVGYLITVRNGVTLALKNITLKGLNAGDDGNDNKWAVIMVDTGGTLILKEGAHITGNTNANTAYYRGGGVYVDTGGLFIMEGGTISGNIASSGGGVYFNSSSKTFTMKAGTIISGNTATVNGGGVMVADGTFTKTGGIIYGQNETGQDTNNKDLKNTAASGHAAYVTSGPKKRDNTAAAADNLDSTQSSTAGGWD